MHIEKLPRFQLAQLPTPVEKLERLSRALGGPELLIKRDDQTGLAFGGNKTRKLEFLIGQALEQGADTLITAGAAQSNHCRQTAAAAAKAGLKCELILNGEKPALLGSLWLRPDAKHRSSNRLLVPPKQLQRRQPDLESVRFVECGRGNSLWLARASGQGRRQRHPFHLQRKVQLHQNGRDEEEIRISG